jgi:hypothetical protein
MNHVLLMLGHWLKYMNVPPKCCHEMDKIRDKQLDRHMTRNERNGEDAAHVQLVKVTCTND